MANDPFYKAHWRDIGPERMSAYRSGFRWDGFAEKLYRGADVAEGQTVADFGCGPGNIAAELARRVGPYGHVHAIDINADFLKIAQDSATAAGVSEHFSVHLNDGVRLPLGDGTIDRITARNTLMYVDDPVATLGEFHRVLRVGGIAHAVDGDWYMMVAEPIDHDLWRAFVKAASFACSHSDMGRKLFATFKQAGFQDIEVSIQANTDIDGKLLGMIRNMANYARQSGTLGQDAVHLVVQQVEQALDDRTYFVVSPQFVVTGRKVE